MTDRKTGKKKQERDDRKLALKRKLLKDLEARGQDGPRGGGSLSGRSKLYNTALFQTQSTIG